MTRDDIIRMAREAGIYYRDTEDEFCEADKDGVPIEMMAKFAALVAKGGRDQVEAEWRYLMVDARKASEQALEALENVRKHDIEDLYGLDEVISDFRASLNMGPFNRGDW